MFGLGPHGNGITGLISATSKPLIKQLLLQNVSHFHQVVQNWFSTLEIELSNQEIELFLPLPGLWSKKNLDVLCQLVCNKKYKEVSGPNAKSCLTNQINQRGQSVQISKVMKVAKMLKVAKHRRLVGSR